MKLCDKCENQINNGHCCMDIYNEVGHIKGPSVTGNVLRAFVMPALIFIGSLILLEYILSTYIHEKDLVTYIAFISALVIVFIFVRFVRTKKTNTNVHKNTDKTIN